MGKKNEQKTKRKRQLLRHTCLDKRRESAL